MSPSESGMVIPGQKPPDQNTPEPEQEETKSPDQEKKSVFFFFRVRPRELFHVLHDRDINATWPVAKQNILENLARFFQEQGRRTDAVEMARIDRILESTDFEFKNPAANPKENPSGTLAWKLGELEQALADELNKRE
ncbi:MAG: hypothetical protein WCW66_04690 [Patescibacteria group bacterium]